MYSNPDFIHTYIYTVVDPTACLENPAQPPAWIRQSPLRIYWPSQTNEIHAISPQLSSLSNTFADVPVLWLLEPSTKLYVAVVAKHSQHDADFESKGRLILWSAEMATVGPSFSCEARHNR